MTKEISYLKAATAADNFLGQVQSCTSKLLGIKGGAAGSYPICGDYGHYHYLNGAAKFFANSLMLEVQINREKA